VSGGALSTSLDELFASMSGSDSSSFIKLLGSEPGLASSPAPRAAGEARPATPPPRPPGEATPRRSLLDEVFEGRPERGRTGRPVPRPPRMEAAEPPQGSPSSPSPSANVPSEGDKPPLDL
jgi:hypothetical protein